MTAIESHAVIPGWNDKGGTLPERLDQELMLRAYRFSEAAHLGQKRLSGEDFVSHCVEVAKILADLRIRKSASPTSKRNSARKWPKSSTA